MLVSVSRVKQSRKEAGHTQQQAADTVYVGRRTWQSWEQGEREMPEGLWELYRIKTGQCFADDEKNALLRYMLGMVEQHCGTKQKGIFASNWIGINASAIRLLIDEGLLEGLEDHGNRQVVAKYPGLAVDFKGT
jgi:putative transcriptional regulator